MKNDIKCPYCDQELEIDHGDGQGYEEDVLHQQQCSHCDKVFIFTTYTSYHYTPHKADCLNDGKHNWKPNRCYPKCATSMVCDMCDEHREPTQEEKVLYKIPTWDEEMKEPRRAKEIKP